MPKRKTDDDDDEDEAQHPTSGSIPNMSNMRMQATEADAPVIADIINYKFVTTEWLNSMDVNKLETLHVDVAKYKSRETIGTAIRSYSQQHALMVSVEDYIILIK